MISTYGLSMTQLGMIGLGFSITYGVGKTLVSYYADGKKHQAVPCRLALILSAICVLGFSASMGAGSTSLFPMIAFYALERFLPEHRRLVQLFHHHQVGRPDANAAVTFLGFLEYLPQPRRRGRGGRGAVWRQLHLFDGQRGSACLSSRRLLRWIVGFIGLRAAARTLRNPTASARRKSCLAKRSAKRTKRPQRKCDDQAADLC
ncbi:hypothetical protein MJ588_28125 [Klebsiella pneumoniae]|nr:hypothetical protein MJ588_28125 [Klebsiella pneumoniae]